jgi:hypothetical protein
MEERWNGGIFGHFREIPLVVRKMAFMNFPKASGNAPIMAFFNRPTLSFDEATWEAIFNQ